MLICVVGKGFLLLLLEGVILTSSLGSKAIFRCDMLTEKASAPPTVEEEAKLDLFADFLLALLRFFFEEEEEEDDEEPEAEEDDDEEDLLALAKESRKACNKVLRPPPASPSSIMRPWYVGAILLG